MKEEWVLNKREKSCGVCACEFSASDEYIGTLFQENSEYKRSDYCISCWEHTPELEEKNFFSYWRGRIPAPADEDQDPLSNIEKVEQLLKILVQKEKVPSKACYVLGVILERKKIIKQVDAREDEKTGERINVFEFTKTGESFILADPHIKLEEIPIVQAEIEAIITDESQKK